VNSPLTNRGPFATAFLAMLGAVLACVMIGLVALVAVAVLATVGLTIGGGG
jgi:uncharacterized membrane protein